MTNNLVVTGGAGFVGSHVCEHFANQGWRVTALDNLSRAETLKTADSSRDSSTFNWAYLKRNYPEIELVQGDIRDGELINNVLDTADAVIHTAGQVAVTSSLKQPRKDFEINALGTFNVLEGARASSKDTDVVFCSTNKVYGKNVNEIDVEEGEYRYAYADPEYSEGIPETLDIDRSEHTPYGTSKLAADLYVQDYAHTYGLKTGVFRMSCIYGTRQFGNEDQGWVAHFVISALENEPITIFGDGKQVRDILYVKDLVKAYDAFLDSGLNHEVFNIGGGMSNTTSLLELVQVLEKKTGKDMNVDFDGWREGDQKVYISDINLVEEKLGWGPEVDLEEGLERFIEFYNRYKENGKTD